VNFDAPDSVRQPYNRQATNNNGPSQSQYRGRGLASLVAPAGSRYGRAMLEHLKANNRAWAQRKVSVDADFFRRLERQQVPEYLWIGCSDSRVPANEIVDLDPGELFVHRNVANLAPPQDANYLSVLQFAVDVLKVKHIMVVGHYGCGGVSAAVDGKRRGLVDHWLHPIREVYHEHRHALEAIPDQRARLDRLCELNVVRQVRNVASDVFLHDAWARGQDISVHGWVYSLANGLVTDLEVTVSRPEEIERLG
jgi:carbonic anhydrase